MRYTPVLHNEKCMFQLIFLYFFLHYRGDYVRAEGFCPGDFVHGVVLDSSPRFRRIWRWGLNATTILRLLRRSIIKNPLDDNAVVYEGFVKYFVQSVRVQPFLRAP